LLIPTILDKVSSKSAVSFIDQVLPVQLRQVHEMFSRCA
jgi:hypothetical protein